MHYTIHILLEEFYQYSDSWETGIERSEKYVIYAKTCLNTLLSNVAFCQHVAIRDRDGTLAWCQNLPEPQDSRRTSTSLYTGMRNPSTAHTNVSSREDDYKPTYLTLPYTLEELTVSHTLVTIGLSRPDGEPYD